jgi:hypothetical protein
VVSDVPRGARDALPLAVLVPEDEASNGAPRGARVAGPDVPDMQGPGRRTVLHAVRARGLAYPRGKAASRTARVAERRSGLAGARSARRATIATVPFSSRAGRGGHIERIVLSRADGNGLVDVERWISRAELCHALEAPVWDRFGSFVGQPQISGTVTWTASERRVVIEGRRGGERFEEVM